jgi:hypothetical protein
MLQNHLSVDSQGLGPVVCLICSFSTSGSGLNLPAVSPPAICLLMVCARIWFLAPPPLLQCTYSNPHPLHCELVFSSVVYSVIFFLVGDGSVCPGGLCWFIPGVTEGYHMMLGSHLFGLLEVSQARLELVASGGGGSSRDGGGGGGGLPVLSVHHG